MRALLRVTGTVQGVGFRPFVYRQATALGLAGTVRNDAAGVLVDLHGSAAAIDELARRLRAAAPPLARVHDVSRVPVATGAGPPPGGFRILPSDDGPGRPAAHVLPVGVDTATCDACLAEVDDPADRRYRYPFTACTACGPRHTIVTALPWDRSRTTMAAFALCARCRREYDDPADRRFHAEPIACADCGPRLSWRPAHDGAATSSGPAALDAALDMLRHGAIVAVKGVGGFHLVADATDPAPVAELRRRKGRPHKPFAVLVADLDAAATLAHLDPLASAALCDPARPIVLVPTRPAPPLAAGVAPGLDEVGVMLPDSPLHHLLATGAGRPLVCTSANRSGEPLVHDDADAATRLAGIVDGVLGHDRAIHVPCEDSVVRARPGRVQVVRRARGHAPDPLTLPVPTPVPLIALGAQTKSTVAVARGDTVVASGHLGDLEHLDTVRALHRALRHLGALHGVEPAVAACDRHPDYASTRAAHDTGLSVVEVGHHHAHVAAAMVEHARTAAVVALAFDGSGLGDDGTVWGGEILVADLVGARRAGHLRVVPLPGGSAAVREPWRMALVWAGPGALHHPDLADAPDAAATDAVASLAAHPRTPRTSSAGRLFDAVAALLGGPARPSYEGQAAIWLEAQAGRVERRRAPRFDGTVEVRTTAEGVRVLDPAALVAAVVAERDRGRDPAALAAGFHEAFGRAAADTAADVAAAEGIDAVVCTGGVFQNARFTDVVVDGLCRRGVQPLVHTRLPANDGAISIGQAAVAAARLTAARHRDVPG